jgi:hypothetical protein
MKHGEAAVMIGDRCFEYARHFRYRLDLGWSGKSLPGSPLSLPLGIHPKLPEHFTALFNKALGEGLARRNESVGLLAEGSSATPKR